MNMDMIIGGGTRREFIDAGTMKEIEAAALAAAKKEEEPAEDDNTPKE